MAGNSAYSEPTEDELKLLETEMASDRVPPAEDDDSQPITPEQVAAEAGVSPTGAPKPAEAAPAAEAPAAAPKEQTEDEKFAAFLEEHKGKTPEELAKLAYQQSQRANQSGFQARKAKEDAAAASKRISDALAGLQERRAKIAEKRTGFDEQLQTDPDAATREVHERLLTSEERELQQEEFRLKQDHMVSIVSQVIPDFHTAAPMIAAFGAEMNYSPEELAAVTDPRDMVTLHLASLTGRLMKAGIMDLNGNIDPAKLAPAVAATDPRLAGKTPVIQTIGSAPARSGNGAQSLEQQLTEIAAMNEKQLEKFERDHPGVLDDLLRKAG